MSLRNSARVGRDLYWTRRGIDEFGGGLLGVLLLAITEKSEQVPTRDSSRFTKKGFFNRLLTLFGCKRHSEGGGQAGPSRGGTHSSAK